MKEKLSILKRFKINYFVAAIYSAGVGFEYFPRNCYGLPTTCNDNLFYTYFQTKYNYQRINFINLFNFTNLLYNSNTKPERFHLRLQIIFI